ncbi:MAG: hypothetical protein IKZ34_02555 [Alphaproteobacteria bacterium]|nr:hypothetical protein [Alphaproteobacteria bacterium]
MCIKPLNQLKTNCEGCEFACYLGAKKVIPLSSKLYYPTINNQPAHLLHADKEQKTAETYEKAVELAHQIAQECANYQK